MKKNKLAEIEKLRESGKHNKAHEEINKLIWEALKNSDYLLLAKAFGERCYVWKHLAQLKQNPTYSLLAEADAEFMLSLAKDFNLREVLHTSHFIVGKTKVALENYPAAIKHYSNALKHYKGSRSEKGDWIYHLGFAYCKNRENEKGVELIQKGIKILEDNRGEVDTFLTDVWLSGAHIRLAETLWQDEPESAKQSLKTAEKIIRENKKLIIRKKQLKLLKEKLKG